MALSEPEELELLRLKKRRAISMSHTANTQPARTSAIPDLSEQIPGGKAVYSPKEQEPNYFERKFADYEALGAIGSGIIGGLLGYAGGAIGGIAGQVASGELGTPEGGARAAQAAHEGAEKLTYTPKTPEGQRRLGVVSEAFDKSKLAGLNPSDAIGMGGVDVNAVLRTVKSGAGKTAGAVGKAAAKIGEGIDPQTAYLARKAKEFGIAVSPDMLSTNKFARIAGEASRDIPLSGAKTAANNNAFNRAIIKLIGGDPDADKITAQVFSDAMDKSGGAIGELSEKHPIPINQGLGGNLRQYAEQASKFETKEVQHIVQNYIEEIRNSVGVDGTIDGTLFRKLRTKLTSQMRTTDSGDLRHALSELDDHMLDAISSQLSEEERAAFADSRKKYAVGKMVEPLVAKAAVKGKGDMSPAAFANQLVATKSGKKLIANGRGGEAADLAAVGSRFMTEPKSSFTTERHLIYGGLLGVGAKVEPIAAASLYGGANLYNRVGPKITEILTRDRSPKPPPAVIPPGVPPLPEVPGSSMLLPGTDLTSLLREAPQDGAPLPQLPGAIKDSLEKQIGAPGSSLSLGNPESKTPLPQVPRPAGYESGGAKKPANAAQESGLLSIVGDKATPKQVEVAKSIEMKLRPEVIERVKALRVVYDDVNAPMGERLDAILDLGELNGTYPGFVMDMVDADATLKKLYEAGKGTQLPIAKSSRAGEVVAGGKPAVAVPEAPKRPVVGNTLPAVPGVSPAPSLTPLPADTPLPTVPSEPPTIRSLRTMVESVMGDGGGPSAVVESAAKKLDMPPQPQAESLLQVIRRKGGAAITEIRDITGEGRVGAGRKGLPPNTFKKEGRSLGDLASELKDEGWDIDVADVDGGVQQLRDMIREELDGEKQYSILDTDRMARWEYDKQMIEEGEAALSQAEADKALSLVENLPPRILDDWSELTEGEKNAELDKLFGADTNRESKGEKGR